MLKESGKSILQIGPDKFKTMKFKFNSLDKIADILEKGGIGVMPTDTIYGLVGQALSKNTVDRIYKIRKRDSKKPVIILVGSMGQLKILGIKTGNYQKKFLAEIWPGKTSVVFKCPDKRFSYLHKGTKTLAVRLPKPVWLRQMLVRVGPLAAPSANIEGFSPSQTIAQAQRYFGKKIDFYLNGGALLSKPSTLVSFSGKKAVLLRRGAGKIPKNML